VRNDSGSRAAGSLAGSISPHSEALEQFLTKGLRVPQDIYNERRVSNPRSPSCDYEKGLCFSFRPHSL
jgi:hypothetical protein